MNLYEYPRDPVHWVDVFGLAGVYLFELSDGMNYVGETGKATMDRFLQSMRKRMRDQGLIGKGAFFGNYSDYVNKGVFYNTDALAQQYGLTNKQAAQLMENRLLEHFNSVDDPNWLNKKHDGKALAEKISNTNPSILDDFDKIADKIKSDFENLQNGSLDLKNQKACP